MAFDGITVAHLAFELKNTLVGGRISKIAQPEKDELLLTIKTKEGNCRLCISASASLPLMYLTEKNKPAPLTAPNFCMLLRKHIGGGHITDITQPGLERIVIFHIDHLNELGDPCSKLLIVEMMGKHSNIIFTNEEHMILDSIKHVSANVSSVREVLPGRTWFIPDTMTKADPLTIDEAAFKAMVTRKPLTVSQALYQNLTGFSPLLSEELSFRAGLDSFRPVNAASDEELTALYIQMSRFLSQVRSGAYAPCILYKDKEPVEYTCLPYEIHIGLTAQPAESISALLEKYYAEKNQLSRMRQKTADLRKVASSLLEKDQRKLILQEKQMKDTEKREKYRIYGEMIHAYAYDIPPGAKSFTCLNYYTNEEMSVPLDPELTPMDCAKKYYDRYNKLKRTRDALTIQLAQTRDEILHLDSILMSLDFITGEKDLVPIRQEMAAAGFLKKHTAAARKERSTSKPLHYKSDQGYDFYVGKNNFQNEELTFKVASGNDWWFHAKGQAGSHVILKTSEDMPSDQAFEDAARLAAYYSKARTAPKADIDYVRRKQIKKVPGAAPGFVIYHTNYSMTIEPDISGLTLVEN